MESQIRSLHAVDDGRRTRVPLRPVELRVCTDGRGDVPDGRGGIFRVVGWEHAVGAAAEVERAAASLRSRGRGAHVDFLRGDGAVVADLPRGDAEGFLAEHVALG